MVLFINACVRKESRSKKLADAVLEKLGDPAEEVCVHDIEYPVTDEDFLVHRDALIDQGAFDHPLFALAKQFALADRIVIAAPYWDLSFPAALKQYIEHVNVRGVTFSYTEEGIPKGLCRATELYYVMTAGGDYVPDEFGFCYIKSLAQNYYGIPEVNLIQAHGLDVIGADVGRIMREAAEYVNTLFAQRE